MVPSSMVEMGVCEAAIGRYTRPRSTEAVQFAHQTKLPMVVNALHPTSPKMQ
jgi:hypothetical protein